MRVDLAFLISASVSAFCDITLPVGSPQLVYSTFVGTGGASTLRGLAVDSSGFAYVAGSGLGTPESDCGFLTKLDVKGQSALWSICLPPTQLDGVALDSSGAIYVIGTTVSYTVARTITQPSTIFKLDPVDQSVIYAVQLPGAYARQIAVDAAGNVFVAGRADASFVPTSGAYSTNASSPTFAAKLNADGSVAYATYLDMLATGAIAFSSTGELWLAGTACPTAFRVVNCNPLAIGSAAAVRRLDANWASLSVSVTFGGGPRGVASGVYVDSANGIAVDDSGAVWVAGVDASMTVPTSPDAIEVASAAGRGVGSGYALRVSPSGAILYGTYLSNPLTSEPLAVALDAAGNVFISGVYLLELSSDGRTPLLLMRQYLFPIVVDASGGLYGASLGCSATTPGAYQPFGPLGPSGACVSKFDLTQIINTQIAFPVNSASRFQSVAVAPGELVTLTGTNLPANPQVSFDGNPAPVIYWDTNRITTVIPFHVDAPVTALQIEGVRGFNLQVWPFFPGLFTADGSGKGQLDARNQDGTVNSKDNPAVAGSIVTVYMTGAGAMIPAIGDGAIGPGMPPFPVPILPISAQVNGAVAIVRYATQAPGMVAGIVRVDMQIPSGTQSGNAKVVVTVNYDDHVPREPQLTTIAVR